MATIATDDPTGEYFSDTWSVVDTESEAGFVIVDDDVMSVASSSVDVRSLSSVRTTSTVRERTAVYGDHLDNLETALTAGGPVPLLLPGGCQSRLSINPPLPPLPSQGGRPGGAG